ncbi:hypothetical protein OIU74_007864 [Salix koriyanagi]|uniref:Uncharacterized protein n=1 Tax=Salix koriyanagi TaxID=2511006 RepID=A0A9Q0U4M0_9ROSI|nr:hypothetical protein OIU74_007864 [Salix koriyanagi]
MSTASSTPLLHRHQLSPSVHRHQLSPSVHRHQLLLMNAPACQTPSPPVRPPKPPAGCSFNGPPACYFFNGPPAEYGNNPVPYFPFDNREMKFHFNKAADPGTTNLKEEEKLLGAWQSTLYMKNVYVSSPL